MERLTAIMRLHEMAKNAEGLFTDIRGEYGMDGKVGFVEVACRFAPIAEQRDDPERLDRIVEAAVTSLYRPSSSAAHLVGSYGRWNGYVKKLRSSLSVRDSQSLRRFEEEKTTENMSYRLSIDPLEGRLSIRTESKKPLGRSNPSFHKKIDELRKKGLKIRLKGN
ncbi:(2Fe-2S) ferredoxin domain-containing protein [Candidatus Micrarchaeota archaeon]|nr:(2Fe-2S) ferredoxin domain-containing protein [Candidatus Micrarchaeota archaeon]MBI5177265.1 (2Fe-2S) ferredoxin domain-containing protein [Candidatus Micrarchaeota archaeon]